MAYGFSSRYAIEITSETIYQEVKSHQLTILNQPKTFGIGTREFSVLDPDGIEIEFTYYPSIIINRSTYLWNKRSSHA